MWTAGSCLLHHDNASDHTALSIIQFLEKPPYSPDISPPDLSLLPKLKIVLIGRRFQTVEDIITNATNDFKAIPQTSFKQSFLKWKRRWEMCIAGQGDCFKGDNIQQALSRERYVL
jgi:hypothetical protein